jgi:hypothetical protein
MKRTEREPNTYLSFKDSRVEAQWNDPDSLHPALRVIVAAAAHWHWRATGQPAVLTCLLRSKEEQRAIYPDSPQRRSPHEYGRAADFRTRDMAKAKAEAWRDWLNRSFTYLGRAGARTALLHEVNSMGGHLHVQVGPAEPAPGTAAAKAETEQEEAE